MNTENKTECAQIDTYSQKSYKVSRGAYTAECAFEYFVSLLVADAFLSSLLKYLGFKDSTTGIILSLISLAFLFQLFSLYLVKKIVNTKLTAILFHFTSQIFFMSLYLVPFFPIPSPYKKIIVVACILIAYFGNYVVTSVIFNWGMSFVDVKKRGVFGANKEMISLASGIVFSLVMGYAVDKFAENGNIEGGFIFTAAALLASALLDLTCLLIMKNDVKEKKNEGEESIFSVIKKLFKNRAFISMVILSSLWNIANYSVAGFMGTYKLIDLGLTVGAVQIINIVACLSRFAVSRPFGAYADKTSYSKGITLGFTIAALSFLVNVFTSPSIWQMVIVFTILYNVCMAGIYQNNLNMTYTYVEKKYFVQATAIKSAISGVCGFLSAIVAGEILDAVQKNGNKVFGIEMRGQQLLSAIAFVITVILILFVHFVVEKQKKIEE